MFKYGTGSLPSPNYEKIIDVNKAILLEEFIDLPKDIDYTPYMSPVRKQGAENTCVGFGVAACKEYFDKKEFNKDIILSPRYVYEEARRIDGHPDEQKGTTIPDALSVLQDQGICEESFWPYIENMKGIPKNGFNENAKRYRIQSYARITSQMDVVKILATHGPCLMRVPIYKSWKQEPVSSTGKIPIPKLVPSTSLRDNAEDYHCICVVGYNDELRTWKFKNSWGSWGDKGYGYLPYDYFHLNGFECYTIVDIVG